MSPNEPFTITSVAKTLPELKKLPLPDQAMALLRRLGQMFPKNRVSDGPHKGNILLPNDSYGIATGFEIAESMPVRMYLLGRPWTWLVNEGYLIDPAGNGFHLISEDGWEAIEKAKNAPTMATTPVEAQPPGQSAPTAFISYSWDGEDHQGWVLDLATRLQGKHGVKIILDQWDLFPGVDKTLFMEQAIATAGFVLVVCTPEYARKSNSRSGGVGYEAMILTSQLAKQIAQRKFIPVLRSGDWDESVPIWIQSKLGVNLSGSPYDEKQYQLLLRVLHEVRQNGPEIGPKPSFSGAATQSPKAEDNAVTALLPPTKRSGKPKGQPSRKRVEVNDSGKPELVAQFQEEDGELIKIYAKGDPIPSYRMDLWIENAPTKTERVNFEMTDKGVEDGNWSKRRSKAPRAFLNADIDSWGNLEVWARGSLADGGSWVTKSWLYDALVRHYGAGKQKREIKKALEQIRDN